VATATTTVEAAGGADTKDDLDAVYQHGHALIPRPEMTWPVPVRD
jgi:hypothetical protein